MYMYNKGIGTKFVSMNKLYKMCHQVRHCLAYLRMSHRLLHVHVAPKGLYSYVSS